MGTEERDSDLRLAALIDDGLRELIDLVSNSCITELQIERGGTKLYIKAAPEGGAARVGAETAVEAVRAAEVSEAAAPREVEGYHVKSPIVGTFYAASGPGADPFVQVGDYVQQGQTVGIVEAMKIMNEIESEVAGRVVEILVENGQAVEYGQTLMILDVSGS